MKKNFTLFLALVIAFALVYLAAGMPQVVQAGCEAECCNVNWMSCSSGIEGCACYCDCFRCTCALSEDPPVGGGET